MSRLGARRTGLPPGGDVEQAVQSLSNRLLALETKPGIAKIDTPVELDDPVPPAFAQVDVSRMSEHVLLNFRDAYGHKMQSVSIPIGTEAEAAAAGTTTTLTTTEETIWVIPCGFAVPGS